MDSKKKKTCKEEGCKRQVKAKGLCNACYTGRLNKIARLKVKIKKCIAFLQDLGFQVYHDEFDVKE